MRTVTFAILVAVCLLAASCGGSGHSTPPDFSPIVGVYHCTVVSSSGPSPYPWAANDTFDATVTDDGHLHLGSYDIQMQPSGPNWQGSQQGGVGTTWILDPGQRRISSGIPGNQQAGLVLTYTLPLG